MGRHTGETHGHAWFHNNFKVYGFGVITINNSTTLNTCHAHRLNTLDLFKTADDYQTQEMQHDSAPGNIKFKSY
jgi:hypothetical protein